MEGWRRRRGGLCGGWCEEDEWYGCGGRLTASVEGRCRARFLPTGEETQDTAHQNVEWRASVSLSEVSSCKAADETFDFETRHGLVAKTETGFRSTAKNQTELPLDGAICSKSENLPDLRRTSRHRHRAEQREKRLSGTRRPIRREIHWRC